MRISQAWLFGALTFGVALAIAPVVDAQPAASEASPSPADRAAEFLRKGNDFYNLDKYAEAEVQYRLAWDLQKAHDVATNLGHAEFKLGKYRDAAELYEYALRTFPVIGAPTKRKLLTERFEEAKKQLGELHIVVGRPGAEIRVDDHLLGNAPLDHDAFVEPGSHRVDAKLGDDVESQTITIDKGMLQEVTLRLAEKPAPVAKDSGISTASAAPIASPVTRPPPEHGSAVRSWLIHGGIAVGAVGLGLGLVSAVVRGSKSSDADGKLADIMARHASCPADGACSDLKSALRSHDAFANVETAGFVIGGAGVAALITGLLMASSKSGASGDAQVTAVVGADRGGLGLRGTF